ncbi:MAG: hypothetical protein M3Y23_03845 [Actinomycetota bacterium]|nr:hypothetical protein [Actinomycetota bacterium]
MIAGFSVILAGAFAVAGTNAYVLIRGNGPITADAGAAEPAGTAIVLGALVESDGRMSPPPGTRPAGAPGG